MSVTGAQHVVPLPDCVVEPVFVAVAGRCGPFRAVPGLVGELNTFPRRPGA